MKEGIVDYPILEEAVNSFVRRHEATRIALTADHDFPEQFVRAYVPFHVPIIDFSDFTNAEAQAKEWMQQQAQVPLDRKGALFQFYFIKVRANKGGFYSVFHHIIADGWSLVNMIREIWEAYAVLCQKNEGISAEPGPGFLECMETATEYRNSPQFVRDKEFWNRRFQDVSAEQWRTNINGTDGQRADRLLSQELSRNIQSFVSEHGCSIQALFHTAAAIYFHQDDGEHDLILGTPGLNRLGKKEKEVFGVFASTLPFRLQVHADSCIHDLLKQANSQLSQSLFHQKYPYEWLIQDLELDKKGFDGWFDKSVNVYNFKPIIDVGGDAVETNEYYTGHQLFALQMIVHDWRSDGALTVSLDYKKSDYTDAQIERMWSNMHRILVHILDAPEQCVKEMDLIDPLEKTKLIHEWNHTYADYPRNKTIHQLFEEQVERTPEAVAVVSGGQQLTYQELNARANQLARTLREQGISADQRVAMRVERSLEMVVGVMGILKAGGAYVPIDPTYPADRQAYMLEDSGAKLLLTQRGCMMDVPCTAHVVYVEDPISYHEDGTNVAAVNGPNDLAYVIYTSGSTGKPKGVMIEHRNVINTLNWKQQIWKLDEHHRVLCPLSFAFDAFVPGLFTPLLSGAMHIMLHDEEIKNPQKVAQSISSHQVTHLIMGPSLLSVVLQELDPEAAKSLRSIVLGGEALTPELSERIFSTCGSVDILHEYGPTESSVVASALKVERGVPITIGRPIDNTKMYIVNSSDQIQPVGVVGELCIAGEGLARGYLNRPELTQEKFVDNPFVSGEKMYRTGDLARWMPDGNIEFIGRIDHQVKIRGYRIELGEIEATLLTIPAIREAVVLARADHTGDQYLCAYVVADREVSVGDMRAHLSEHLSNYMIPAQFVQLKKMPLSPNGKIDRKDLEQIGGFLQSDIVYEAPRNEQERMLADIWQEVLGVARIGIDDHFLERGGHSLKAMMMLAKVEKQLGMSLSLGQFFKRPTIRAWAEQLAKGEHNQTAFYTDIERIPLQEVYAVSPAQKRMYLVSQMEGAALGYNIPETWCIEGTLDPLRLEAALQDLVKRHESLRTSFAWLEGRLVQRIEDVGFSLAYASAPAEQLEEIGRAFVQPFDLAQAPLFRAMLVAISPTMHWLLMDMHHIISDGISMNVLLEELWSLYRGEQLPSIRVQYKDYAAWQHQELLQPAHQLHRQYWNDVLRGELPVLNLPLDRPRPALQIYAGSRVIVRTDAALKEGLLRLAQDTGSTLYMVLLAVYNTLLAKYTDQADLLVGTPVAGRNHADTHRMVGMFVNTLVMRNAPEASKTFRAFLEEVKANALEAYDHQDYPFDELVEQLHLPRDTSRNPLFDTMFTLQNMELDQAALEVAGLHIRSEAAPYVASKFDLTLTAIEAGERLELAFEYRSALFESERIERMAGHLLQLMREVVNDPEQTLQALHMLTASERRQLIEEFNHTDADYPRNKTIPILFAEQVEKTPDAVAVVFEHQQLTYGELNERANRLARTLRQQGVGADQLVAIMVNRSIEMIVGVLGILKAGGAYVPIDPSYPVERVQYMLEDSGAKLLLTQREWQVDMPFAGNTLILDETDSYHEDGSNVNEVSGPTHLAYVIYTSGSTGKPKGVMVEHRAVVNRLHWMQKQYPLTAADRILQKTTFTFDVSVWELMLWMFSGASMVLLAPGAEKDPEAIAQAISTHGATTMHFVPSMLSVFLDTLSARPDIREKLSSLRYVFTSGEALHNHHVECFNQLISRAQTQLVNLYGPTEAAIDVTYYDCPEHGEIASVPIGKPIDNIQLFIVDGDHSLRPIGLAGELCIAGVGLARGYLNRAELTAEKFVNPPFLPGERMYRTGDLARWLPDGNIEYVGRIDHQVKIRGYRIELGEIEAQLLHVPAIRECVVLARQHATGDNYLCAYVVTEQEPNIAYIRAHLSEQLPEYMIPSQYVQLEHIPLAANGKLDRKALEYMGQVIGTRVSYEAPRTAEEHVVATVWQSVLGAEYVGAEDHFFYLGGDSIKAIQVISRLYQAGYQAEMKALFQSPTLSGFSRHLQPIRRRVEQTAVQGEVKATPILHWFFNSRMQQLHHFNQSMMLHAEKGLEEAYLRQAIAAVIRHHDALRLVVRTLEPEVTLWNRAEQEGALYELDVVEWSDLTSAGSVEAEIERRAQAIQSSFDIERGPLVKLILFRCDDGDHLLIVIHHLVIDGVSWRILLEDLATAYEQAQQGQAIQLPEKSDSFQSWSERLHAYANSEAMEQQRAYWQAIEQTPVQPLPKDSDTSVTWTHESELVHVQLEREATTRLLGDAHRAYGTEMNDLLLAAFSRTIEEWAGIDELVLHMEGHGREALIPDANITRTVGWFTSMYPVKLSTGAGMDWGTRIKQVKEELRRVPHKGMGYGMLRYISKKYALAEQLKPEIVFNYLGQFDADLSAGGWGNSPYAKGDEIGLNEQRQHDLDINGAVSDGQLSFTIRYSRAHYHRETLERLAVRFQLHLQDMIAHCAAKEQVELTPSDVVLDGIGIQELDQLVEQMGAIGDIENVYPLTPMQEGMLFHSIMESGKGAYFEQVLMELRGPLDVGAFRQSMERLQQRHEILRSNVYSGWQKPVLVVFKSKPAEVAIADVRAVQEGEREAAVQQLAKQDQARGFDLCCDALVRATIVQTGEESCQLIWSFHHLLMDGWCMPIVWRELLEMYFATVEQREPQLSEAPAYRPYIEWLAGQDESQAADYWRQYLQGYEQHVILPGQSSGTGHGYTANKHHLTLSKPLTDRLQQLAKSEQVTLNTVLQTVWGVLLQKYNNSNDVVFGSVVSGRPAALSGVEEMVGLFINTIPVRIQRRQGESFADMIRRNQDQALASAAYDFYPLYQTQAQTELKQDLINHILIFENYPMNEQIGQLFDRQTDQRELHVAHMEMHEHTNYDFNVIVLPGETLSVQFGYNADAYPGEAVERIAGHWLRLLEQIALDPQAQPEMVEIVDELERKQLVEEFNDTAAAYPQDKTIHQLFEDQVALNPQATAVVFEDQQLTYRELNARANQLARTLRDQGVGADQLVAIMAERSVDMIVGLMGILKAGGAYVPIDPSYPAERVQYMLEDSGAKLLLTERRLQLSHSYRGHTLYLDEESSYHTETANVSFVSEVRQLAYVIYTSGSTGQPKGVMVEHRNIVNSLQWKKGIWRLSDRHRVLCPVSFAFDAFVHGLFTPLISGAAAVIVSDRAATNPEMIADFIAAESITHLMMGPGLLLLVVDHLKGKKGNSLRSIALGGEALTPMLSEKLLSICPGAEVIHEYGPTEASVVTTAQKLTGPSKITIGQPIANSQVHIVDEWNSLQPIGVIGELCISGDGLARGYLNRPELTAEKFVSHPFLPGERMYRTGDLARWLPDGSIEYIGRIDHQVKIRGYRVELGEIEAQLLHIPAIRECVVLAKKDASGSSYLCAYLVSTEPFSVPGIRAHLAGGLPEYMIPSQYVQLDHIPLTANGKLDRKALEHRGQVISTRASYEAPRTAEEHVVATVWQSVLGAEYVGAEDHFFYLGGDSIKAIQVISRLYQAGYQAEMKALFQSPTLSGFSRHLQPIRRRVEQTAVQGEVKATPILHWFFNSRMQQPHHFNQSMMLHAENGLEEAYLRQAIAAVIRHHDALRLVVRTLEPEVTLWNRAEQEGELYELDMVGWSDLTHADSVEAEIERRAQAIQSSFDIEQGPLVKLILFRCADGDHLLIVIHHLVIDGVSWRILLEDLTTAYEQAQQGQAIQLPEKSDSFQSWSERLHAYANSEAMEQQRAYWQAIEQTPVQPLPKDSDTSVTWTCESDLVHVQLEREATARLLGDAHRAYGTEMNDLLLAAFSRTIEEWAGIDELVLHMEGHGREPMIPEVNITRTVGWFTSMYPVKLSTGTGMDWGTRIKQVKEELRRVPHKGIGYGMLRYVSQQYALAEQLKPEIVFNYLGQFDADLSAGGWGNSPYAAGDAIGMNEQRQHDLDINGAVNEGQLSFTIRYSRTQYERETLERLAAWFQSHLQDMIVHCTAKEQAELTPSDVLLDGIGIQELDQLVEQMSAIGDIENVYPLTPMQKGMLFHSVMEAEKGAYFQQSVIALRGPLDVEAFRQSMERLQQRHEILRSNVYHGWQEPVMVIFRNKAVELHIEDIRSLPQEQHEAAIRRLAEQDQVRGFDLKSDCLMRAVIVRTGDESWQFIWSFHHLLMDGWCMPIVWGEWLETYFALVEQREPQLPAVVPYSQYIDWLKQQDEQDAANYWNEYVKGYDQHIDLPGKRSTNGRQYAVHKHHLTLSEQLTQGLQTLANNEQATLNTVIQAAWGVLLQKYNGSSDVVFGSVVSGRPASLPGVEQMVGLFINTIPVRIHSQPDERFVDIVRRNQEQALVSATFDFYPLYQTQAQTEQRQDLINHILIFENYPMNEKTDHLFARQAGQRRLEVANMEMHEHNNYDFNLVILPGTALSMRLEYNAEAYDGEAIERLAHHWQHLLEQIVAKPQGAIAQYELVTASERQQVVDRFNDTEIPYPRQTTVQQLFEAQVAKTPHAIAIVFENQQLTYRQLNERANQLARTLRAHGIGQDQLVALLAERSLDMIVGLMAVLKAGGAYVPIDPTYPAERVRYMLEDSGAKVLLTQSSLHNHFIYSGTTLYVDEESCYQQETANLPVVNGEAHLAYVIYTSGSTGKPKGVMVEHRNVNNFITGITNRIPVASVQKILVLTTLSFDIFVLETWLPLSQGVQIIIANESEHKDADLLGKLIQKHQVDMLQITPSRLKLLVSHEEGRKALRGLQHLLIGGETVTISQVNEVRQWSGANIYNMYGPTETTVWSTIKDLSDEQEVSIGTPIANTQIYILNSCNQLLPVGVAGQLCIAGAGVTRGYLHRPDLTGQKFVDNPFVPGEKLYLTGDLARWLPDGNIEYISRIDHQVKIRGYRIELGEIEDQLQQIHMIDDGIVLAKEDESGSPYLCAYVVTEQEVNTHELRLQLLKQLPDYMIPAQFIRVDTIPLTANGKVNRLELLKIETPIATGTAFEAPRSEFEANLADIWKPLLHVDQISINDNFFELGGNSLLVMQLDLELDKRGIQIYPFEIFNEIYRYQTIKELSDHIFAEQSLRS